MQKNKKFENPPTDLLRNNSLFLDFDGTLAEIAPRPEDVFVSPIIYSALNNLLEILDQRLAIVSGRSVQVLREDFGFNNITIAGSHGNEIALAGDQSPLPNAALDPLVEDLQQFAAKYDGLLIEPKSMGVGLHFRAAPDLEAACKDMAFKLAEQYALKVQAGKMLFEIYSGDEDKGSAITKLCALQPFLGSKPIFIGDDKTDEYGFTAVAALGGAGILVGPERDSAAIYRLDDVASVHAWLAAVIEAQNKG